jgi:hypothetical protein
MNMDKGMDKDRDRNRDMGTDTDTDMHTDTDTEFDTGISVSLLGFLKDKFCYRILDCSDIGMSDVGYSRHVIQCELTKQNCTVAMGGMEKSKNMYCLLL